MHRKVLWYIHQSGTFVGERVVRPNWGTWGSNATLSMLLNITEEEEDSTSSVAISWRRDFLPVRDCFSS